MDRSLLKRLFKWLTFLWGVFMFPLALKDVREAAASWLWDWQMMRTWLQWEYAGLIFPFFGMLLVLLSHWPKIREFFWPKTNDVQKEDDGPLSEGRKRQESVGEERPNKTEFTVRHVHNYVKTTAAAENAKTSFVEDAKTSFLSPKYRFFKVFGDNFEVGTVDAWLRHISSPVPLLEPMPNSPQQTVMNTYIDLFFEKDDGGRFSIRLRNMMPPGVEGSRFTILWVLVNGETEQN